MARCSEIYPVLKQVSRSFYATIWILPRAVRFQIGLAYLLARTTDTIADTDLIPVEERLSALRKFRERLADKGAPRLDLRQFAEARSADIPVGSSASAAEREIVLRVEEFLGCFDQVSAADQELIRSVLTTIISGQELDLRRFANAAHIVALPDEVALDDYTYRVAGCVGEFWSRLCRAHLFPNHPLDETTFVSKGVRFGKGLQLVNVLRDLPADLRQGRCYLPANRLAALGVQPSDLLEAAVYERVQSFYNSLLGLAAGHLEAGWEYTNMLPRRCVRLRLACAWPILIGFATLSKLRRGNVLDGSRRIKISRAEVRRLIAASLAGQIIPGLWSRLPARAKMV